MHPGTVSDASSLFLLRSTELFFRVRFMHVNLNTGLLVVLPDHHQDEHAVGSFVLNCQR